MVEISTKIFEKFKKSNFMTFFPYYFFKKNFVLINFRHVGKCANYKNYSQIQGQVDMQTLSNSDIAMPSETKKLNATLTRMIENEDPEDNPDRYDTCRNIPGYAGFVKAIYGENMYGETYGRTTLASNHNKYYRGIDYPAVKKFQTTHSTAFPAHNVNEPKIKVNRSIIGDPYLNSRNSSRESQTRPVTGKSKERLDLILKDGETRGKKVFVNPFTLRKKTEHNPKGRPKPCYDHLLSRHDMAPGFQGRIDMNSWGTNRKDFLKELNDNKDILKNDKMLTDQVYKLKENTEFIKEMPIRTGKNPVHQKIMGTYDIHNGFTKGGYSRHQNGYPYMY